MNRSSNFLIIFFSTCLFSCAFAPVNNQYEKAATLKKGNLELTGSFSDYSAGGVGGTEHTNRNFGFRAGYGITDKFDLKLRYERLMPTDGFGGEDVFDEGDVKAVNYFSIIPKFSLVPEKLSLLVPLSQYAYREETDGKKIDRTFNSISPQIIYTLTGAKKKSDFSFGVKADCLLGDNGGGGVLLGTSIGAGFSSDLDKWAIRPEVGALFIAGGAYLSYGVGLQFLVSKNKKRNRNN